MSRKPALLQALNALKEVDVSDRESLDAAFNRCRTAPDDIHYAHALYREIGEIALKHEFWEMAEEFAIRTLVKMPSNGAALKLLGMSLRGRDRFEEASICHRYGLPPAIREKYFANTRSSLTDSEESDKVSRLPAYPPSSRTLKPPLTLENESIWELSQSSLESAPAETFHIHSARLWFDGFNTIILDKNGHTINEVSRGFPEVVQQSILGKSTSSLSGRSCLLGNRNAGNYYHWMNDILPRIQVLKSSGISLDSIDQFLINPLKHRFQYETLEHFGIDESRLCSSPSAHYHLCEELFVPMYGSNSLGKGQAAWSQNFLRDSFLRQSASSSPERLYISRKHSSGRCVHNEEQLVEKLRGKGFRCVTLEGMSVQKQATLFNNASVVLGSHGAALTNIAFCKPDTTIIELYKDHIAPCYWISSELMSLRYAALYCGDSRQAEPDPGSESYHQSADLRRLSDFTVDLDRLEKLLQLLEIH